MVIVLNFVKLTTGTNKKQFMGKGDKKSKRGKIARGTYGVSRPKKKHINSARTTPDAREESLGEKKETKKADKVEASE